MALFNDGERLALVVGAELRGKSIDGEDALQELGRE